MRIRSLYRAGPLIAAALAIIAAPPSAVGQTRAVAVGAVETDSERLSVFLFGLSAHPTQGTLVPTVGLTAYHLASAREEIRASLEAVSPSAGIRYQYRTLAAQASIGYLFLTGDAEGGFGAPLGAREGVVVSAQAGYVAAARSAVADIAYNRADGFLWGRGRATQRLAHLLESGELRVGVEGVGEAARDPELIPYRTLQAGGILELRPNAGVALTVIGGAKADKIPGHPQYFPYFKLELTLVP
jgi:hypothetical protein